MAKENLYYSNNNYVYTKKEATEIVTTFIIRKLESLIKFATVLLVIVTVIALYKGEKAIQLADEQSQKLNSIQNQAVRMPLEVSFWYYINNLEIPKDENLQMQSARSNEQSEKVVEDMVFEGPNVNYTQSDIELLAQLMYAEEGIFFRRYSQDPQMVERVHKLAGSVVIHRTEINYLGCSTIESTIFKEGQYAQQTVNRVTEGQDIPNIVYTWAEELLMEGALGPKGLIYQAEFEQGDEKYDEIGNQHFCIESKYN